MRDTSPKQEWNAPRIVRLDAVDETESGTIMGLIETNDAMVGCTQGATAPVS